MDPTTIAAIIGSVTGVLALLMYFIKIGGIITKVNTLWEKDIPEQLKELNTKTKTLWAVYVEDRLRGLPPDYTGSYYLTKKGEEILPAGLKEELKEIAKSEKFRHIDSVGDVVPLIIEEKIDSLRNVSVSANISLGDAAIVASLYAFKIKVFDELLSGDYLKIDASAIKKMPDSSKQKYLDEIILKFQDDNVDVRRRAAMALGRIGDARVVDALIVALKDKDEVVRRNAASALGAIGDAEAVEALVEALKEGNADLRRNAAKALRHIGDPGAVEALKKALKDPNTNVRRNAALALGRIGDPRAVEALKKALEVGDADLLVYIPRALEQIEAKQKSTSMEAEKDPSDE